MMAMIMMLLLQLLLLTRQMHGKKGRGLTG
jgi:hypothetical protein